MKKKLILILYSLPCFIASAQVPKLNSVSFTAGSLGFGTHVKASFSPKLDFRLGASFFQAKLNKTSEASIISFEREQLLRTGAICITADWRAFKNSEYIALCGGIYYQLSQFKDTRNFWVTDTKEDLGQLTVAIKPFPINPYLGILIGKTNPDKKINYFAEIGTLFHGIPKVDFTGSGRVEPTASQGPVIRENLKFYNYYPVLNLHLNYNL
jgi:hypothetical protein